MVVTQAATEKILSTRDLVKVYAGSDRPAVDGLNLEIDRGSIFGLLGPNGAGKTTTISILCTLLQPTSGQAIVLGQDVRNQADAIRRRIGVVPQDIALYPSLTARENLRYFARILRIPRDRIEQRIDECLELVGLRDFSHKRVADFSGGMKRRTNLAVGILHEPELLFLDEPTVGIDAQSRNLILDRLGELNRAGMSMLYTSHYMEEVRQLCHDVVIIDHGRAIAAGTPDELVAGSAEAENLEELFLELTGRELRD
ncbi:MAG: ABC transporter [Desulfuromonas sp.]|nr:MAG: ABC transporter [Desulfuromonas sp.]